MVSRRLLLHLAVALVAAVQLAQSYGIVSRVDPRYVGLGGAVRLTIQGRDFAKTQFSLDDPEIGNFVTLVSDLHSVSCPTFKDATTETMIQCDTPKGMYDAQWRVKLTVDGETTPDSGICNNNPNSWYCSVYGRESYSPYISQIVPRSGPADQIITIHGRFYTDRYGPGTSEASNGRTELLKRVYVQGKKCELKDGDDFYGLELTNGDFGYVKCKITGVGAPFATNASVLVDPPFGRTYVKPSARHLSADGELYMYQTYAVVEGISAQTGSNNGHQTLTISGKFFDETTASPQVKIGDADCEVVSLSDTELVVKTPMKPAEDLKFYPGNRGMKNKFFNTSVVSYSSFASLLERDDSAVDFWSDGLYWCEAYDTFDCFIPVGVDTFNVLSKTFFNPSLSGEYQFYINVDDQASVLMGDENCDNMTEIAFTEVNTRNVYNYYETQKSEVMNFTAGERHCMHVIAREYSHGARAYVGAKYFKPNLVERVEGKVEPEVQTIKIGSNDELENVQIKFTDFSSQSGTPEIQKVTMSYTSEDSTWQLGMNGVYTDPMSIGESYINLAKRLKKLPTISPATVSVTSTVTADSVTYIVTFDTVYGDWPLLTRKVSDNKITVTIESMTEGVASLAKWRLHLPYDGEELLSDPITTTTPTVEQMEDAVESIFTARCTADVGSAANPYFYEQHETRSSPGYKGGTIDTESEPLCGKASVQNPGRLYHGDEIDVSFGGHMCFGYRGTMRNIFRIQMKTNKRHQSVYPEIIFKTPTDPEFPEWHYTCIDLLEEYKKFYPDDESYRLTRIDVYRELWDTFWVDEVIIAPNPTTTDEDHGVNFARIGLPIRLDELDVSGDATEGFDVAIRPHHCVDRFHMMRIYNAPQQSGSLGTGSSKATFGGSGWPTDAAVEISRSSKAAAPVTGTFELTINSKSHVFDADVTEEEFKDALELHLDADSVRVTKSGSCYGYSYSLEFTKEVGGDVPPVTVDGSSLVGNTPTIEVVIEKAHLFFDPIPGDMLETVEDTPQVAVTINNIRSKCVGDCSYAYSDADTPTFTSVTPLVGSLGTEVTIAGTKFSTTTDENVVTIGEANCAVTSSTETQIVCTLGAGDIGEHDVMVVVPAIGKATGSATFEYNDGAIDDVTPASGSTAGGVHLTITGSGFTASSSVTVGGDECKLISRMASTIVCETPPGTGSQEVKVTVSNTASFTGTHEYRADKTTSVTSYTPVSTSPAGGATLELNGDFSSFIPANENVKLYLVDSGDEEVVLTINADTTTNSVIEAELPSLETETYTVKLWISQTDGFAAFASTPEITVDMKIKGISIKEGSMEGGTRLVIGGNGFGTNKTLVKVTTGPSECDISELTDTSITCHTGEGFKTALITNHGVSPEFGLGYQWDPLTTTINAGDQVRFKWTSPPFITDNKFKVMQTNEDSTVFTDGFDSGEGSPNGEFSIRLHDVGTYYFSTGVIGKNQNVKLSGSIVVVAKEDRATDVVVSVGDIEAVQDTAQSVTDSEVCGGVKTGITGCSNLNSISEQNFQFVYRKCRTPVVTSVDVSEGFIDQEITITGDGFSTTACENEVMIGDFKCVPSVNQVSKIVCALEVADEPAVGLVSRVKVRVNNRGDAFFETESTYNYKPSISSISPSSGSFNGGTKVTISGAGFVDDIGVMINGVDCDISSSSYQEIVCVTKHSGLSSDNGDRTFPVEVLVKKTADGGLPVECSGSCDFSLTAASTPSVDSVVAPSDNVINEPETAVTISGSGFGTDDSKVSFKVGDNDCSIDSITDTEITCTLGALRKGPHQIVLTVDGKGIAKGDHVLTGRVKVEICSDCSGSIYGGQLLTIAGTGFVADNTAVDIDNQACVIEDITVTQIRCITPAHAPGVDIPVAITVSGGRNDDFYYTYDDAISPKVTAISPTEGVGGAELTITGTGFGANNADNKVAIGGVDCAVTSSSITSITCTAGISNPKVSKVVVTVDGIGRSDDATTFTYTLSAAGLAPAKGSFGGMAGAVLSGSGFNENLTISVCEKEATVTSSTADSVTFDIPAHGSLPQDDVSCTVKITIDGETKESTTPFVYERSTTPVITGVSPKRGGTQGGTSITIEGSNFGSSGKNTVTLAGAACTVTSETSTEIICTTGVAGTSVKTNVVVEVDGVGYSVDAVLTEEDVERRRRSVDGQSEGFSTFWYVDVWSSTATWGGGPLPTEGDFIVIKKNQLLLLDTTTPKLKMLLIQGGELVFDEKDLTLNAENILIVDDGKLTVGTEEEPFQHDATIMLHGQLRAPELPIYGAKCLAIREGELNMHGKPLRMTWTRLARTADQGATEIVMEHGQADWPIGGTIAIATTGDRHSQKETELREIKTISDDGKTITFDEPLEYTHLGVTVDLGGGNNLEMRAEVAVLSRNVKVQGSRDQQWSDDIEACEAGFDTGEFTTQTCFQGRFGDEEGSDQFGAQIMFHAPEKDTKKAIGKLSFIEVTYAGQAFKLGRYPVHFHLNGDMSGTYVRGLAIHETFNRAVNVHGTHNVRIEHTVIYNVMGGAFFLEDGIETGNVYEYNLALFVKASSSLLNDDITPAAFWATNPNNHYSHNAVAGGTHFGFWYRLLEHPEGPSFTTTVCPRKVPLGTSYNNSVHSNGWFGLWTFQDYYPMEGGSCSSNTPEPAVFRKFIVWNCEKGLEYVNGGALQFSECILANNKLTALEGKKNMLLGTEVPYTDRGPMIENSIIAAYAPDHEHESGGRRTGIILPWSSGFAVKDVTFINFDKNDSAVLGMTAIQGTCSELCGGWNYHMSGIKYINGDGNLARFRWLHDGVFVDLDGTYSGTAGNKVLPWMDTMNPNKCVKDDRFSIGAVQGAVCDSTTKFSRFSFNGVSIPSMNFKDVHMTNEFGTHIAKYADKRMTHPKGWMTVVEHGQTYKMVWENVEHIVNFTYNAVFEDLEGGGVVITHNVSKKPDLMGIKAGATPMNVEEDGKRYPLNYADNVHGDFYYDKKKMEFSYLVSDVDERAARDASKGYVARNVAPNSVICYYPDCKPPPNQNSLAPLLARPDYAVKWSNPATWPNNVLPADDQDVEIAKDTWVVADMALPRMKKLTLYGNLELEYKPDESGNYMDFTLEADYIVVMGGRLVVGWENSDEDGNDKRFKGNVEIILNGNEDSPNYPQAAGPSIGQKVLAVFGGLDLHGIERTPVQTTLALTANAGATQITLKHDVDWKAGEEIMITSTSMDPSHTEVVTISNIDNKVITFTPSLQHRHLGEVMQGLDDRTYSLAAEVALLTRNIVVKGAEHDTMVPLGFGGRVLVGSMVIDDFNVVGWARISGAQFKNMGQLGFNSPNDPRFALTYLNTGPADPVDKPSYITQTSFHMGLSPQIGIFGGSNIRITDNVMYQTVGGGMLIHGTGHTIERNTIALNLWPGTYDGRNEVKNVFYEASFEMVGARDITFHDNIAAGSERAGFRVAGETCDAAEWSNNKAHSSMFGVMMWEGDEISTTCFQVNGYFAWKNFYYGIFIQTPADKIVLTNNRVFENTLGVWTHAYGPGSLSHVRKDKTTVIEGGAISGPTEWFDCTTDKAPSTRNVAIASQFATSWTKSGGFVGLSMPNGDTGPNGLPTHPFKGAMSYPTIQAHMMIKDIYFYNFGVRQCNGKELRDYIITSNPSADDLNHPVTTEGVKYSSDSVDSESLAYYFKPNVGKVNPSDCVDMECDGHKHAIIQDIDGTFLGSPDSYLIGVAEVNWDDDPRYGVGDYRIPKVMLTLPDNTRVDPPKNKGIYRTDGCTKSDSMQAYKCEGTTGYRLLVIESMDKDTEVRRLSPIAMKVKDGDFVDLINGPQDHGWCAGYTCQKRISTFWVTVALEQTYELYMTGSNPQHTRVYLLYAENKDRMILSIYYHSPQRLDVYGDNVMIYPKNTEISNDGDYSLKASTQTPSEYLPTLDEIAGTNWFDREYQQLYLTLKGDREVDIFIKEVVIVSLSLPPMTIDDFFGENIINNLATFLGVPSSKIRIVDIVSESSRRRRRQSDGITLNIEIGDPPNPNSNTSQVNDGDLKRDTLLNLTRKVVDTVQLGSLGSVLNVTILGVDVQEPLPIPENSTTSAWAEVSNGSLSAFVQIPSELRYTVKLVADKEQQPFPTQPKFEMMDVNGDHVLVLGSRADPWKIRAVLRENSGSDANAKLVGETICGFKDGICAFENLGISHSGSGYIIDFEVFDPAEATYAHVSSAIELTSAELTSGFSYVPDKDMPVEINEHFSIHVDIRDLSSLMKLDDIAWKNHTWVANLEIYTPEMSPAATLGGVLQANFDPNTGLAVFDELTLSAGGRFFIKAKVTSTPAQYDLMARSTVVAVKPNVTMQSEDISYKFNLRSSSDYDTYAAGNEDLIEAYFYNHLLRTDSSARYHDFKITRGSVEVEFWVSGENQQVSLIIQSVQNDIEGGFSALLPNAQLEFDKYMLLDDQVHAGLDGVVATTGGTTSNMGGSSVGPTESPNDSSKTAIIAGAVVGSLVVIAVAVVIAVCVLKKKQNIKGNWSARVTPDITDLQRENTWATRVVSYPIRFDGDMKTTHGEETYARQSPDIEHNAGTEATYAK